MIPKIIHYCWFGRSPLPPLAIACIASWRKYLPDYKIVEWNEDNFDVNIIPYTRDAYNAKMYAFVSDYARFWILYNYGGLYFDTDVEVIRPLNRIIDKGPFMGCENWCLKNGIMEPLRVAPGLGLGANAKMHVYKEILNEYQILHFTDGNNRLNLTTVVTHTTNVLLRYNLKNVDRIQCVNGIFVYPKDYFCPIEQDGHVLNLTDHTVCIHHYAGSWIRGKHRYKRIISRVLGPRITRIIIKIKRFFNL